MASRGRSGGSNSVIGDAFLSHFERQQPSTPSIVVVGGGISGIGAAHVLCDASFKVILLESWDRLSGRVHTYYTFGCPVDVGSSCYALFDIDGCQVPQQLVNEVEETFKRILKETEKVRDEHATDMSVHQAISIVLNKHPDLREVGLAYEVLQWYICRMEAWFAADANMISLKNRDQEHVLSGGHGLMVQGYHPLIKALSKGIDIRLNHRSNTLFRIGEQTQIS